MAEIYSFDEAGMRKLATAFHAQKAEISNLRRHLMHVSTRRHEAVYMPSQPAMRYVKFDWLPAAYGGTRTGISGSAATTNGNTNPSNLQYFPKLCTSHAVDSSTGEIDDDFSAQSSIYVANLSQLPLTYGWALAYKLTDSDPNFGTVWATDGAMMPSHYAPAFFSWTESQHDNPSGYWEFLDGAAKLIRTTTGSGFGTSGSGTVDQRNWAFGWGLSGSGSEGDVMLSHYGRWEVTYGFTGYIQPDSAGVYDLHTTSDASAGTSHTHTIKIPAAMNVQFGIHVNFEPGTTVIGDAPDDQISLRFPGNVYGSLQYWRTYEKTCIISSHASPWHGQHHTRISPFVKVAQDSATGGDDLMFIMTECWMSVRPAKNISISNKSAYDYVGAGANQYPGGYNTPTAGAGTFVWYGGGSEPIKLDEDGASV